MLFSLDVPENAGSIGGARDGFAVVLLDVGHRHAAFVLFHRRDHRLRLTRIVPYSRGANGMKEGVNEWLIEQLDEQSINSSINRSINHSKHLT